MRCCGNCKLFYPLLHAGQRPEDADTGECRRFPPVPDRDNRCFGDYPVVAAEGWCGEHRPGIYAEEGFE